MKAIISQPMKGKPEDQIRAERAETVKMLEGKGYEVVDTVFPDFENKGNVPLKYLAKSLETIADVDLVYFMPGWKDARGCKIEHECCVQYDVKFEEADGTPTVKMKKGDLVVNIRATETDIFQAKTMGFVLVDEVVKLTNPDSPVPPPDSPVTPPDSPVQTPLIETTEQKTGLAALGKKELLAYIGKRKLYDKLYDKLEPEAIIPLFLNNIRTKIVEAKAKTADEAAAMAEKELLDLFDTLK